MSLASLWVISATELRSRLGRSMLTGLSLFLGVISVVSIQMISSVAEQTYIKTAEMVRGRQGTAQLTVPATPANRFLARQTVQSLGSALMTIDETGAQVQSSDTTVNVRGYFGDILAVYPWDLEAGRVDGRVLMNEPAGEQLQSTGPFLTLLPTSTLPVRLTPSAVVDDGTPSASILAPELMLGTLADGASITVSYVDPERDASAARARLSAAVGRSGMTGVGEVSTVDVLTALRIQTEVLKTGFFVAAAVTLGVGIVGILNIGLATLETRTEELALRRSLGASRLQIRLLVLLDGIIVGGCGALLAVIASVIAFRPLVDSLISTNPPAYPWTAAVLGVAAGLAAGFLGGLLPALRAGAIPIGSVMRA